MRRLTLWVLIFSGLGFITFGLGILFIGSPVVYAQENIDLEDAEYVGASECGDCHRTLSRAHSSTAHGLTLQSVGRNRDLILGNFSQSEDVPRVQFPGDNEARPLEASDIAYVVGSGRNIQRYLYAVSRNEYMVLPVQWNVNTQSWESYQLADEWPSDAYAFGPNCAGCHTTGLDTRRFRWEDDAVQCESCHGPGSVHLRTIRSVGRNPDEEGLRQIRASIVLSADPQICGQCHSQGHEPKDNLPYPAEYRPGQNDLLDAFTLVAPDDSAHWYASGHARQKYMQFNESLLSAHTTALSSMLESEFADNSCLQCHSGDYRLTERLMTRTEEGSSARDPVTLETARFGVTCVNCHEPHSESIQPVDTYALCVDCHARPPDAESPHHPAREMFEGTAFVSEVEGIPGSHFSAEDGPRCTTCHMPEIPVENVGTRASHRWSPILPGSTDELQDSCTTCHTDFVDVAGMQRLVADIQASTQTRLDAAKAALANNSPSWVNTSLAFVEGDGSLGIHNYAYTDALLKAVEGELGLAPTPISQPDLAALLNVPTPPAATTQAQPFTGEVAGGLTTPSIILLAIAGLVIAVAAYAFFFRRPQ